MTKSSITLSGKRVSCLAKEPWKETNNKEMEKPLFNK